MSEQYFFSKEQLDSLFEGNDIIMIDITGKIIDVNKQSLKSSRYSREELIGLDFRILHAPYHSKGFEKDMWQILSSGQIWKGEICKRSKFGEDFWEETTIIPMKNDQQIIQQFMIVSHDISKKKSIMTELKNIERTFRVITENVNDLIVITNEDGIILYVSPSYYRRLGYLKHELIGRFYEEIIDDESKDNWRSVYSSPELLTDGEAQIDLLLKTKNQQTIWTEGLLTLVTELDKNYNRQYVMVSREITQRKEVEEQLMFMAYHDSLTNLPNRRFLMKEFPRLVKEAEMNKRSFAVLYIDGDNFKEVNDLYGHEIGDQFIKNFGITLSNSLRTHDIIVRQGGDEFIVVLTGLAMEPNARQRQINHIIARIQLNLLKGWDIDGHTFTPTSSIGVAYYPDCASDLNLLLDIADRALFDAKKIGKNSCVYSNTLSE